jgi:uncharacterized protein (DUF169 family)
MSSEMNKRLNDVLNEYIRPATFPVAVKIYKKGEEVPFKTRMPIRDLKHRLAICQGMTIARKYGWVMGFTQEDQACPLAQVILGYTDEPEFIKDGSVVYPLYVENMEAAAKTQASTPKMPNADTGTVVLAALHKADFDPDVVVVYGNPAQVVRMVQGGLYKTGGYVESRFAGRGACGGEITVPYSQDKYNVIIPGGGEKVFALTGDDELAFALPGTKIDDFITGLVATHDGGVARIPTPIYGVNVQPAFPKYYWELEKYCGLRE